MCPISQADGCESFRELNEPFPVLADGVDDVVIGFEDTVGEDVGAHELRDVLDRLQLLQLQGARGQQAWRDVVWPDEGVGGVPTGTVDEEEDGMGALGDVTGDFVDVQLHCPGVGEG